MFIFQKILIKKLLTLQPTKSLILQALRRLAKT